MTNKALITDLEPSDEQFYQNKFAEIVELVSDLYFNVGGWMRRKPSKLLVDDDMVRFIELDPLQNYPHEIMITNHFGGGSDYRIGKLWLGKDTYYPYVPPKEQSKNKPTPIKFHYFIEFQAPSHDSQRFTLWEKDVDA